MVARPRIQLLKTPVHDIVYERTNHETMLESMSERVTTSLCLIKDKKSKLSWPVVAITCMFRAITLCEHPKDITFFHSMSVHGIAVTRVIFSI